MTSLSTPLDDRMLLLEGNLAALRERAERATSTAEKAIYDGLANLIQKARVQTQSA